MKALETQRVKVLKCNEKTAKNPETSIMPRPAASGPTPASDGALGQNHAFPLAAHAVECAGDELVASGVAAVDMQCQRELQGESICVYIYMSVYIYIYV